MDGFATGSRFPTQPTQAFALAEDACAPGFPAAPARQPVAGAEPGPAPDAQDPAASPVPGLLAPPPDTVVAGRRDTATVQEPWRMREAALRDAYEAEIARLQQALSAARQAHAGEIERLRAQTGREMRRIVEALWQAQDAALRAAAAKTVAGHAIPPRPCTVPAEWARTSRVVSCADQRPRGWVSLLRRLARFWCKPFRAWN